MNCPCPHWRTFKGRDTKRCLSLSTFKILRPYPDQIWENISGQERIMMRIKGKPQMDAPLASTARHWGAGQPSLVNALNCFPRMSPPLRLRQRQQGNKNPGRGARAGGEPRRLPHIPCRALKGRTSASSFTWDSFSSSFSCYWNPLSPPPLTPSRLGNSFPLEILQKSLNKELLQDLKGQRLVIDIQQEHLSKIYKHLFFALVSP